MYMEKGYALHTQNCFRIHTSVCIYVYWEYLGQGNIYVTLINEKKH